MTSGQAYELSEPHGPTSYPAFNGLYWALGAYQAGRVNADEMSQRYEAAREELEALDNHIYRESTLRALAPAVEAILPEVYRALMRLRELLDRLGETLEEAEWEASHRLLGRLAEAFTRLDGTLARISALENERPPLSESPLVNELLYTCFAYLEGTVAAEAVTTRTDALLDHFESSLTLLEAAAPLPLEVEVLESSRQEVDQAVETQLEALGGLKENLEDPEAFLICMEEVRQATDRLVAVQHQLARAANPPENLACVSCGAEYALGDKVCVECGARLPPPPAGSGTGAGLDVTVGSAPAQHQTVMTENVQRLVAAADAVRNGTSDPPALAAEVQAMRDRLEQTRNRLASMPEPEPRTPEDQLALFQATRAHMVTGLDTFAAGLDELEAYQSDHGALRLEAGISKILEAQSMLLGLQLQTEQVIRQASARPPG